MGSVELYYPSKELLEICLRLDCGGPSPPVRFSPPPTQLSHAPSHIFEDGKSGYSDLSLESNSILHKLCFSWLALSVAEAEGEPSTGEEGKASSLVFLGVLQAQSTPTRRASRSRVEIIFFIMYLLRDVFFRGLEVLSPPRMRGRVLTASYPTKLYITAKKCQHRFVNIWLL